MINFIQIMPEDIDKVWDACVPLLKKSFDRSLNDYDENDIREYTLSGEIQLWVALDSTEILGCAATMIAQHPKHNILNIINLGGNDLEKWVHLMDTVISGFAIQNNCKAYRAWTRRGFSKYVPSLKEDGAIYVKLLGGN